MRLYVVYDNKAQRTVGVVMPHLNDVVAIRSFGQIANHPETDVHKYPSDYELRFIGTMDDTTGVIAPEIIITLCTGAQCLTEPQNQTRTTPQLDLLAQ